MRRFWLSLAFLLATPACTGPVPRARQPASAEQPKPAHAEPAVERALVTGCKATPATVYGDEPVAFAVEGPQSTARAELELLDHAGHALVWDSVAVPGTWRPADVPSGDFTLQAGPNRVTCIVTVNRELSRGRAAEQK